MQRPRVQLRNPSSDASERLRPGFEGRWQDLPADLSLYETEIVAHMVNGYEIAEDHLHHELWSFGRRAEEEHDRTDVWHGTAVELLATFFTVVRGWRGLYEPPSHGDKHHQQALSLYEAVRARLRQHPKEAELVPAERAPELPPEGGP